MNSEKERLLCYTAGIIGSTIANPNCPHNTGTIPDWLIKHAIESATKLIQEVYKT